MLSLNCYWLREFWDVRTLVMGAAGLDWPFNRATADDFRLPWPCLDIAGEYCS